MKKRLVLATLEACENNQTKAADMLGISSRTIRNMLYELGIKTPARADDSHGGDHNRLKDILKEIEA